MTLSVKRLQRCHPNRGEVHVGGGCSPWLQGCCINSLGLLQETKLVLLPCQQPPTSPVFLTQPFQPPDVPPGPSCATPKEYSRDAGSQIKAQSPAILGEAPEDMLPQASPGNLPPPQGSWWRHRCKLTRKLILLGRSGAGGGYQKHPASAFPDQNSQNFHFKGNLETLGVLF